MGTDNQDMSLRSLAYEIKQPLIRIARASERGHACELESIQQTAEQTLRLIDTYLLSAQADYGQVALDLSPESTGSILYDAAYQLRTITPLIDNRNHEPIMTHRAALISVLNMCSSALHDFGKELTLRSYKTASGGIGVGVFTDTDLSVSDLRRALDLQGRAPMTVASFSGSGVSLAIADSLCTAIGGSLTVKRMGSLSGLVTELPRSEQLALV